MSSIQAIPLIGTVARDQDLPVSLTEEQVWFFDQLYPGSPLHTIALGLHLDGVLNVTALRSALDGLASRHEILRTCFRNIDGRLVRKIAANPEIVVNVIDLTDLDEPIQRQRIAELAFAEAQQPFDLGLAPLMRTTLLRLEHTRHVLLLTIHHIIAEHESMVIITRELGILYETFAKRQAISLEELPVQYADFAYWQRRNLQGERLQSLNAYWKRQLDGMPSMLQLPTDFPRPPIQTFRGSRQSIVLSEPLTAGLKNLARQAGSTLFETVLATLAALLYHYTGQDDIAIGSPIVERGQERLKHVVGLFGSLLVMRTNLSGNPSFLELLARVSEVVRGAYAHQDLPFARVVEEVQPVRDLSMTPLIQAMFVLHDSPLATTEAAGLRITPVEHDNGMSKFDLMLSLVDDTAGLQGYFEYCADLFEPASIDHMASRFTTLLQAVVDNPRCHLTDLPILSEHDNSLSANTCQPCDGGRFHEFAVAELEQSIVDRFTSQVEQYSDKVAIESPTSRLTYRDLDLASTRIANRIRDLAGTKVERVALLFAHGTTMIVATLGVLKTGGAYVPLDPSFPIERLVHMTTSAAPTVLLTDTANVTLATKLAAQACPVINVDMIPSTETPSSSSASISPDAIAYILYTSGSTGTPKGIMQSHRNVLYHIGTWINSLRIGADDKVTLLSSYAWDSALQDTFGALLCGATVFVVDVKANGISNLARLLTDQRITVCHMTVSLFRFVTPMLDKHEVSHIRVVVLGGDLIHGADVALHQKHFSDDCVLVNAYGATESSSCLLFMKGKGATRGRNTLPLGYPVAGTEVLLLDDAGERGAVYGTGEIVIKSPYVALGYWQDPDETQRKFKSAGPGTAAHLYFTGDLGRMLPDGAISYVGRKDFQVKIRGFRIEVGEVEGMLRQHPDVQDAVIAAREDTPGERYLVGYLVARDGRTLESEHLRRYLSQRLPEYMIPQTFIMMTALPLTPSRKIDRQALPDPRQQRRAARAQRRRASTPTELTIAEVWQTVLNVKNVYVDDNFFDLGGHSLLAVQVIDKLEKRLGLRLNPAEFMFQTVGQLATVCDERIRASAGEETVGLTGRMIRALKKSIGSHAAVSRSK